MREIKFRAWKKKKRIFIFWRNIFEGSDFWEDVNYPDTLSVMQYTGLKDKNGKEIYEGDIVRTTRETEDSKEDYFDEEVTFGGGAFNPISLQPEETWEVIGNIWENPELL